MSRRREKYFENKWLNVWILNKMFLSLYHVKPIKLTVMKFIGYVLMLIITVVVQGFLFMKLWLWFIVPVFTTLPTLNLGQSIGLSFVIAILKNKVDSNDKEKEFEDTLSSFFLNMLYIGFGLLIGWGIYCGIQ